MATTTTIDRICQAAIRTATRDGLLALTIDNVAKEAGVSKGGVMYHFPSKEQLLTATLTYYSEQAERMLMRRIANDPEPHRRWARAMLGCLFPDPQAAANAADSDDRGNSDGDDMSPEIMPRFMMAVLAAAVNNPGLIEPLRQLGTRMRKRLLSDPDDGLEQLMIWLAVDGLFLWQFVGMIDQADPVYQQIGEALRARAAPLIPAIKAPANRIATPKISTAKIAAAKIPATKLDAGKPRSRGTSAARPAKERGSREQ